MTIAAAPKAPEASGRVAVVTGGSGAIGLSIAERLAADGHTLVLTARDIGRLEAAAGSLRPLQGREAMPVRCDATDQAQVDALAETVVRRFGRIDVLVNCAANPSGIASEIEQVDGAAVLGDLDTKVVGCLRTVRAVAPAMKRQAFGRIVNIGGLTGRSSNTLSGLRNVAISHLTKTLSDQLGPFGVTVNAVHPGIVRTPHLDELFAEEGGRGGRDPQAVEAEMVASIPIRRVLDPAEIAAAVAFLVSPGAAGITGESLTVDGGYSRGVYL